MFTLTAGTFEEKSRVCQVCKTCNGKPPLPNGKNSPEAVAQRVVFHIESIVRKLNAGTIDLNELDYSDWLLLEVYRDEERRQESIFRAKLSAVFEALVKQAPH